MKKALSFFKKDAGTISGFIVLFALVTFWSTTARLEEANTSLFDILRTTEVRNETVIVAIDDKSLQEIGAWPWDRSAFARLSSFLEEAGAAVTAYDVLFFEPRAGDEDFKKVLTASKTPILLASKLESTSYMESFLVAGSSTLILSALADVTPDVDGKIRNYPETPLRDGICTQPLGVAAFYAYTRNATPKCAPVAQMFRYPGSITTYSLTDVIEGRISQKLFENKVVFVGATALGLGDQFNGLHGNKIPGVFVHASIFTSLLNSVRDNELSKILTAFSVIILMLIVAVLLYLIRTVTFQFLTIGIILLILAGAAVLDFSYGVQLPFLQQVMSVLVSAGYVLGVGFMRERKENKLIASLFSKYVHKDVLQTLLHSGKEVHFGGEKRDLSVLFSDIRGFTKLSESLSPEDLTSILNAYLSAMTPQILEEKGTIDKFIGDAIMAFWNAPLETEKHATHALYAALRMHEALQKFNEERGLALAMGIGIHTGPAVVGNVGGEDRVNYTALGDTVNLASRIEGLTKKYGVPTIVTKAVHDAVDDPDIVFRCLDVITVLGKSLPTTLYEPLRKDAFSVELVKDYEKAYKYYYDREWNKAENIFKRLAKLGDAPSQMMLVRIPLVRKDSEWDGIWRWDEK